jgi:hypothetical protein
MINRKSHKSIIIKNGQIYICILLLFSMQRAFAGNETPEIVAIPRVDRAPIPDSPIPLVNGISTRLIPEQSETITLPKTYFSFGVYQEFLMQDTQSHYSPSGLGVMLGFQQHIRGMWSGGVEVRWADWRAKVNPDGSSLGDTSPLSVYSKVEATPDLRYFIKDEGLAKVIRPYFGGGIGYTLFFDERSLLAARSKTAFGQVSATYGGGVKIILPSSFSIKVGVEEWRGLQTSDYFSQIVFFKLSFGDVDKF